MCGSMLDIQSATAEFRRGKKDRKKIEWPALFHRAAIIRKRTKTKNQYTSEDTVLVLAYTQNHQKLSQVCRPAGSRKRKSERQWQDCVRKTLINRIIKSTLISLYSGKIVVAYEYSRFYPCTRWR